MGSRRRTRRSPSGPSPTPKLKRRGRTMLPTRLIASMKTTVMLNGLMIPFNQAVHSLSRFCRPLAFHNDSPDFELSMVGSAIGLRVLGMNVLISSRHQLGKGHATRDPGEVVVVIDDQGRSLAVTGDEAIRVRAGPAGDLKEQDLFILRFNDAREGRDMRSFFCRLGSDQFKDARDLPDGSKVLAYAAIGFPTAHQDYGIAWDEEEMEVKPGHVRSRWVRIYLDAVEATGFDEEGLSPFQIDAEQIEAIGDPDGLSGSPILMLYQDASLQAHFAIAGVIVLASKAGRVNAYPGRVLGEALSQLALARSA